MEDADPTFEPQQRARSNTWPLPRPDNYVDGKEECGGGGQLLLLAAADGSKPPDGGGGGHPPKKNSSRRNAWGNMSYADLITQAIQSSPDKRLTLSQIYDWMVQNVPYFKDKGDSNSSAGWKNSIRHNLSLHNRFMRVQNEGTGKSSWWMINPDAKPGKAARRRATSMETQKYEKKRGRIKKKVEALRNGLLQQQQPQDGGVACTPSPSSSISESLDMFPESPPPPQLQGFQLSPDFRQRAGSNASSCGRLSPIPAIEADMHDSQVPPMSPIPWDGGANLVTLYPNDRYGTDQLVDTLTETMKLSEAAAFLSEGLKGGGGALHQLQQQQQQQQAPSNGYSLHYDGGAPSRYADYSPSSVASPYAAPQAADVAPSKLSPQRLLGDALNGPTSYGLVSLQALSPAHSVHSLSPPGSVDVQQQQQPSAPEPVLSPHSSAYPTSAAAASTSPSAYCALSPPGGAPVASAMLRAALTPPPPPPPPPPQQQQQQRTKEALQRQSVSHMMGQLLALNNGMPNDLDLSMDALQGGLECDVDQVIRHELTLDGNLDFNFPPDAGGAQALQLPTATTSTSGGRHWVH